MQYVADCVHGKGKKKGKKSTEMYIEVCATSHGRCLLFHVSFGTKQVDGWTGEILSKFLADGDDSKFRSGCLEKRRSRLNNTVIFGHLDRTRHTLKLVFLQSVLFFSFLDGHGTGTVERRGDLPVGGVEPSAGFTKT